MQKKKNNSEHIKEHNEAHFHNMRELGLVWISVINALFKKQLNN